MRVLYHDYVLGSEYPHVPTSVNNAEALRQKQETACILLVSPDGTEIMLVGDTDGQQTQGIVEFANDHAAHHRCFELTEAS